MSIVIEIVTAIRPTNGVATFIATVIASNGIAIIASPNPTVERVNVETKMIGSVTASKDPIFIACYQNLPVRA